MAQLLAENQADPINLDSVNGAAAIRSVCKPWHGRAVCDRCDVVKHRPEPALAQALFGVERGYEVFSLWAISFLHDAGYDIIARQ